MKAVLAAAFAALALASTAAAVDTHRFRYERSLSPAGPYPVRFEPDGPLYSHSRAGFADLRIIDAAGRQVPWRMLPVEAGPGPGPAPVLDRRRPGGGGGALLRLRPPRPRPGRPQPGAPGTGVAGA